MQKTVSISVRSRGSRYVALNLKKQDRATAEGRTVAVVADKARMTGRPFSMMLIPERGKTYVF
jgi:translation initiation factor IF-3